MQSAYSARNALIPLTDQYNNAGPANQGLTGVHLQEDLFSMHEKMRKRVLEVRGVRAFASINRFYRWMNVPCPAFGNQLAARYMETQKGFEMVLDELGRIEKGV